MTTDSAGNWVAVWYSEDSLGGTIGTNWDILVARSTDNGATWTAPAALNTDAATDSRDDYGPQVTTDGGGNWVVVWYSAAPAGYYSVTDRDILYATEYIPPYPSVGGVVEMRVDHSGPAVGVGTDSSGGSAGRNYIALAALAAAALVALGAGGWYARRRWVG